MRENRTHGSEGGETGKTTGLSYPYSEVYLRHARPLGFPRGRLLGSSPKALSLT